MTGPPSVDPPSSQALDRSKGWRAGLILAGIIAVGAGLRGYELGRLSFWYDEVVTMRLARAGSPSALIDQLFRIDATRAPLHPLLLEGWIAAFGRSEAAARSLSVLCGLATIGLVFAIGRVAFDVPTGLWAAWLSALSPALIVYSREARMYAWLTLLAGACWRLLLSPRVAFRAPGAAIYVLGMAALVYSHPLGLLMIAALALAGLVGVWLGFVPWRGWLVVHLAAGVLAGPWVVHYLDHPPEFLSGPLPLKSLVGTPIGFIGGDSRVLAGLVVLIAWGFVSRGRSIKGLGMASGADSGATRHRRFAWAALVLWLIVPPVTLYVYSRLFQPIFGPQRYTVFVAPAYLILVAAGLARLPRVVGYPLALALSILAVSELGPRVYDRELKADWRAFAAELAGRPAGSTLVLVARTDPGRVTQTQKGPDAEVETARYYLPAGCETIRLEDATPARLGESGAHAIYLAAGSRKGVPVAELPERLGPFHFHPDRTYPGLTILRAEH